MEREDKPPSDTYEQGVVYEILRESLNNEMARHLALARDAGYDTDDGKKHLAAKADLANVRELLDPNNPGLLQAVQLMLRSSQSDRMAENSAASTGECTTWNDLPVSGGLIFVW